MTFPATDATQRTDARALVVTGGHDFVRDAFEAMWDSVEGLRTELIDRGEAAARMTPDALDADVLVLYDISGLDVRLGEPVVACEPSQELCDGWSAMLDAGVPMLFLHHAIASWPAWPGYAEIAGARFNYSPATVRGQEWPPSGFRLGVSHDLSVVDHEHPVCEGLELGIRLIDDETYLCPVFEDSVVPLLVTDADLTDATHWSVERSLQRRREDKSGWSHPEGSRLAAWARQVGRSRVVYIQPGHAASTYANQDYRRLVANAVHWLAADSPRLRTAGDLIREKS